jgi:hypothetical protein
MLGLSRRGPPMPLLKVLILGFIAGFIATLIFHQGLWYLLNQVNLIPPERPAWPLDPIPPFGVPSVISKAFWGRRLGRGACAGFGAPEGRELLGELDPLSARWRSRLSPSSSCRRSRARPSRLCGPASSRRSSSTVPGVQKATEGKISEVTYWWPRPGSDKPLEKTSFYTKAGDQICGVGYYK